jgi:hypothetical protein
MRARPFSSLVGKSRIIKTTRSPPNPFAPALVVFELKNDRGAYLVALSTYATKSSTLLEYSTPKSPSTFACEYSRHSVGVGACHSLTAYPASSATHLIAVAFPHPGGPLAQSARDAPRPSNHARNAANFFAGVAHSLASLGARSRVEVELVVVVVVVARRSIAAGTSFSSSSMTSSSRTSSTMSSSVVLARVVEVIFSSHARTSSNA